MRCYEIWTVPSQRVDAPVGDEARSCWSVLDAITSGEVELVVNTRRPAAALDPALAEMLDEIRPLGDWLESGTTLTA
jgi:hypothetical protein